ncbi:hypothetical protein PSTT_15428 [Puccinia striiformis]|uniref:Myotubularin phosphatase domain-containing protein n=1 Tax=Puccinia striiformis TaxID=27350 RepID=A0A2S4UHK5_9BASI|nr:hypothetical protein PSTT_15428 [Puccinia striiformis]
MLDVATVCKRSRWELSCSAYPSALVTPSKVSDTTLTYAVKYRSEGSSSKEMFHRLPTGTYVHRANGQSFLHTGPVAIGVQPSQQVIYGATSFNLIIEARPTINAMANTVQGAGTKNMKYHKECLVFAIDESFVNGTPLSLDSLKRSAWLKHIGEILEVTFLIEQTVHVYNSHVLIRCSDGWDSSSQLSALSQVCLDPYYRTSEGFAFLVEKERLSFGRKNEK